VRLCRGAEGKRINAFGRRSLGDAPIGCLADSGVNEKRLCIGFGLAGLVGEENPALPIVELETEDRIGEEEDRDGRPGIAHHGNRAYARRGLLI